MADMLTSQFEAYVNQYETQTAAVMKTAKAQFRDSSSLDSALSALKSLFEQADAALDKYGTENTPLKSSEQMELSALGTKIKSQIDAVTGLFPTIEAADITYIQSAKVATLDQPTLKEVAEKMKAADSAFSKNLEKMAPPTSGGDPDIDGLKDDTPETDGDNIENVPEADEIVLISG